MIKSREDENSKKTRPRPSFRPQAPILLQPESVPQGLRNRTSTPQVGSPAVVTPIPGRYSAATYGPSSFGHTNHAQGTHAGNVVQDNDESKNGLVRRGGYVNVDESDNEERKRGFDGDHLEEHETKKFRVEGEEMVDGDEDAEFEDLAPKRGSKRVMHDEDMEYNNNAKKFRGKRSRKISLAKSDMDVDEEDDDQVTELPSPSTHRGKKRDRTEAGSTFGGDDDDSAEEPEDSDAIVRRRRKRRTVSKRKSEASHLRGKKRDRVTEDDLSEGFSEGDSLEKSAHKKGKHSSHRRDRAAESDISMEDSSFSRSKIREIGDEWESNGVKYKIGPNGQRLRQALVKKARQKFVMPKDSLHPDRDVNLQVCIETWLTEEEYQEAKAQHNLAWQDDPETKNIHKLTLDISSDTASVHREGSLSGKNLLWSSTSTPTGSPVPQTPPPEIPRPRTSRLSMGPSSLVLNPFSESQIPAAKRIASNARAIGSPAAVGSSGLSDSTNSSPRKVLSKWEKQELEARAMMKIREATRKKEQEEEAKRQAAERARTEQLAKERQEKERIEKEKAEKEKAEQERKKKEAASMPPPPNPTTATPAPTSSGAGPIPTPSAGASSFFSVPNSTSTSNSTSSGTAPAASLFSMPPAKASAASSSQPSSTPSNTGFSLANPSQPSSASSGTPAANSSQPAPPAGGFSFANPSASSTTPASSVPPSTTPSTFNFSAPKKDGETANTATSGGGPSLMSRLGPQVSDAPKPSTQPASNIFSFAKPTTSGTTTSTTASNPFGQPASSNPFGQPASSNSSSTPTNGATTSTAPSSGGSGLKFNFAVPNKTATTASAPSTGAVNGTGSSLSGALGSDPQKPGSATGNTFSGTASAPAPASGGASLFSFKTPTTPASATNAAEASTTPATNPPASTSTAPTGGLKFNFGTSPFATQGSTANKDKDKEPPKSGFGAPSTFGTTASSTTSPFGNTSNTSSPFGGGNTSSAFGSNTNASSAFGGAKPSPFGNASATTTSAFGNIPTTSAFGNKAGTGASPFGATAAQTSSVFGGGASSESTTKPADSSSTPKFNFGGASSTAPASDSTASKPTFSFGSTSQTPATPASGATSTTPASTPASGGFSFNFGGKTTAPTTATTTPSQPPPLFGTTTTPGQSAFGNLSNTTAPSNVFGGAAFGAPAQSK
ncbi:hypothetical protein JR316_0004386 [Psilocybe cubensis]|nr:hypothetical protein JR316_0004386 [Psilocybe cubensis]KAH9482288.1 hypothetical protein JR316_0004386 [Psilocybe cubensis]